MMDRRTFIASMGLTFSVGSNSDSWQRTMMSRGPMAQPAELAPGVIVNAISSPTSVDLNRAARLASVNRQSWTDDTFIGGFCFDLNTGGPKYFLIEESQLNISAYATDTQFAERVNEHYPDDRSGAFDTTSLPTAFLAKNMFAPAITTIGTDLALAPGEGVGIPHSVTCSKSSDFKAKPVVFLEISFFPQDGTPPPENPGLGIDVEPLDINFGALTANASVPASVIAGRMGLQAGVPVDVGHIDIPMALCVESADVEFNVMHEGALLRRSSTPPYEPSWVAPSGDDFVLSLDDCLYLPALSTGTFIADVDSSLLLVGVQFGPG